MKKAEHINYFLRIGVVAIFAAHGWLVYHLKPQWFHYLHTVGITGDNTATIMQAIGIMDFAIAIITLIKPLRPLLLWATVWAFSTALIRPIAGEAWVEFFERAGNWICPLVLYLVLSKQKEEATITHSP